jgi:dTDP-glucose pyrophosphorylase
MNWKKVALPPNSTLEVALRVLDDTAMQIILVTDSNSHLLGTLTDGDIRRALLKGAHLDEQIVQFMNSNPTTAPVGSIDSNLTEMMRRMGIHRVPLIDSANEICGLAVLEGLIKTKSRPNPVLIMAGGRGERLKPLTDSTPKPLLTIAGQPLIEILLGRLASQGFHKIWISVHYKAEDIINRLGDGSQFNIEIEYLKEETPLGTAGAIKLLPAFETQAPILVCNSDLMNSANFGAIVDHHVATNAVATMTVSKYLIEIPFGVIQVEGGKLKGFKEKPVRSELISAGINVFNTEILPLLPKKKRLDIPDVYTKLLEDKANISIYELEGYWLDVGTTKSMKQAEIDHNRI